MSEAVVGSLRVNLGLETAAFSRGVTQAQGHLNTLSGSLKGFAVAAAAAFTFDKLVGSIEHLAIGAAEIGHLSEKLGVTTDELQNLQYGAVKSSVSIDELQTSLLRFSKSVGEARNRQGELFKTFQDNGIDQAKLKTMSYGEALNTFADLVKNARSEQDKMLLVSQAMGKGSSGMLLFLKDGSAGLEQFAKDADTNMLKVSASGIEAAAKVKSEWEIAMFTMTNAGEAFVANMARGFNRIVDGISAAHERGAALNELIKNGPDYIPPQTSAGGKTSITNSMGIPPKATKVFDPVAAALQEAARLALERHKLAVDNLVASLKIEGEEYTKGSLQMKIDAELHKANVTAMSKEGQEITALVIKNEKLKISQQNTAFASQQLAKRNQEFNDSLKSMAEIGVSALDSIALQGQKAADVFKNLVKQLASAALQAAVLGQGPLAGLFGTTAGGGIFGSLFTPKLYAAGGTIPSGQVGIVGEAGPEYVQGPATVIPMGKMPGGGHTLNFTINAPGADRTGLEAVRAELRDLKANLPKYIKTTVSGEKSLNPRFAT